MILKKEKITEMSSGKFDTRFRLVKNSDGNLRHRHNGANKQITGCGAFYLCE